MRSNVSVRADRRCRVSIRASDPLTSSGLDGVLRAHTGLDVLSNEQGGEADVVVVAGGGPSASLVDLLDSVAHHTAGNVVLVLHDRHAVDLFRAIERGVAAIVLRSEATTERLGGAVLAVSRGGVYFSTNLQAQLVAQIRYVQRAVLRPHSLNAHGLTDREVDVLRLVAGGLTIRDVGDKLACSERTVKNILYAATSRLGMRSRTEVVAYAARVGAI